MDSSGKLLPAGTFVVVGTATKAQGRAENLNNGEGGEEVAASR
jgi:hypothetical protein